MSGARHRSMTEKRSDRNQECATQFQARVDVIAEIRHVIEKMIDSIVRGDSGENERE